MTRDEFFASLQGAAKWDVAVAIARTNPLPIDANSVFDSFENLTTYAQSNPLAYPGQIVSVLGETEIAAYLIKTVGEGALISKLASSSASGDVAHDVEVLQTQVANIISGTQVVGKATADAEGNVIVDTYATKAALATTEANAQKGITDAATAQAAAEAAQATADAALPKATYDEFIKTVNADAIADAKKAGTDANAALEAYKTLNDPKVAKNTEDIAKINTDLAGLTGAMHFIGTSTTDPVGETGATVEGHETFKAGDVCLFGDKEYVYNDVTGKWVELGDEGSHATKGYVDEAKQAAIDAANTATDEKLKAYSNTTAVEGLIATAKTEAITEAGTNADAKIADALKDYTTTANLTTELGKKVDKVTGKSLVDDTLITKMEGLKDNAVIKGVEGGIKLDETTGKISVDAATMPVIAQNKVDGLDTALAGKQDANQTLTDIAALTGQGLVKKTADGVVLDTNTYLVEADLADYAKSADVTAEIGEAVADKQTAAQVNALIAAATIQGSKVSGKVAEATLADKVANMLTVGTKEYNGSEAVEITAADLGALTAIPAATAEALGGIQLGYESTDTKRAVELDENNKAFVQIPAAMVYGIIENGGLEMNGNNFGIKEVSTDKLIQGTQELILNGGAAALK